MTSDGRVKSVRRLVVVRNTERNQLRVARRRRSGSPAGRCARAVFCCSGPTPPTRVVPDDARDRDHPGERAPAEVPAQHPNGEHGARRGPAESRALRPATVAAQERRNADESVYITDNSTAPSRLP